MYNWAKPNAETGFHGWLRRVGTPPVIYNQYFTDQSVRNLTSYFNSRGYYQCVVSDSVIETGKKKKMVIYRITLGPPTIIDSLSLITTDTLIQRYAERAWEKRKLSKGHRLDYELLMDEAKQIEIALRNQGFYNFTTDIIGFTADTLKTPGQADVTFHIPAKDQAEAAQRAFKRFYIDSIIVLTRHNPIKPLSPNDSSLSSQQKNNIEFRYPATPGIRFSALTPMILFRQDSLLRQSLIERSQANLLGMGLYQQASIEFRESALAPPSSSAPHDGNPQEGQTLDTTLHDAQGRHHITRPNATTQPGNDTIGSPTLTDTTGLTDIPELRDTTELRDTIGLTDSSLSAKDPIKVPTTAEAHQSDPSHLSPATGIISLARRPLQGYQVELLLTSSGAIGSQGGITYYHRNIFNGSELLELSFQAQVEAVRRKDAFRFKLMQEYNVGLTLTVPRFTFPHAPDFFLNISNARTVYRITFNYQKRPNYTRSIIQGLVAFRWNYNTPQYNTTHSLSPVTLSAIYLIDVTPAFAERITRSYLAYSYISQIVSSTSYSLSYTQRPSRFSPNIFSLRLNLESAGNALWAAFYTLGRVPQDGVYRFAKLPFAQFIKGDINLAYLWVFSTRRAMAFRLFAGVGFPYGNSQALPFDRRYFQGGANGVRAWHARDLGPGSYYETALPYPNQTADLKLEANVEYRFNIYRKLEGALFVDAGNIWSISSKDERPGAQFKLTTLPKTIAVGYGAGIRYNFNFLIFRLDVGVKLYDPAIRPEGDNRPRDHWIPRGGKWSPNDYVINFGVGYPF